MWLSLDFCAALKRAAPALAVHGRLPRSGKPSRLILSLRSLPRRVRMRVGDRCQAHRCAGGGVGSTRITETELAARNRRAGFPAPLGFADQEDEARLRSTWPAPDGRGRPAPARRGRAAMCEHDVRPLTSGARCSCPRGERVAAAEPCRTAARCGQRERQFEKCVAGAAGRGGAVSPLTPGSPVRPTDCAPACGLPPAAAGIVRHSPEMHFSARRRAGGFPDRGSRAVDGESGRGGAM